MPTRNFHDKPYDAGTLAKLRVFEYYTQEWIPVFVSRDTPIFKEVHIFDFFCGPGSDTKGEPGSPLRILQQLRAYQVRGMAGWKQVRIVAHFFDSSRAKIELLKSALAADEWSIPGVEIECRQLKFQDALEEYRSLLANQHYAKLLIIDQCGVDEVSVGVFQDLITFPVTDFIFFISSSTLYRFRQHPNIKQKIEIPEHSFYVHREVVNYYRSLIPPADKVYLGSFSIKKRSNIYGLIFGSRHPLGIHKFLHVVWTSDDLAGEANFDIEGENISPGEGILPMDYMRPNKIQKFESELKAAIQTGTIQSEADVARFCIEAGMTCQHCAKVLKELKDNKTIILDFRVPDIDRLKNPRPIRRL